MVKPEMAIAPAHRASGPAIDARAPAWADTRANMPDVPTAAAPSPSAAGARWTAGRAARAWRAAAQAALLAGPTALAFFDGGFFDAPRTLAAAGAWMLVAVGALAVGPPGLSRAGLAAVAGLTGLVGWTALSQSWAPLAGPAQDDLVRTSLYLGALVIGASAFASRSHLRRVEPALGAGALVVVGYGLAGRLLPGVVEAEPSLSAAGRLDQPLGYWNATGALAGVGLVLCIRVAGDRSRAPGVRAGAAAAATPLGLGLYLSFSRGAIAALAAGLLVLVVLAPTRAQLRAAALAVIATAAMALAASRFAAVESLRGVPADQSREGVLVLAILLVISLAAALAQHRSARLERDARSGRAEVRRPRRSRLLVVPLAAALVAGPVLAVAIDGARSAPELERGATPSRLTTAGSNRYEYWEVAVRAAARRPLRGIGSGGYRVDWVRERTIGEAVIDAHSLPLETAAELGAVGLALMALFAGGVAAAARRVHGRDPELAAGLSAALAALALHATIDWDWELPALSLVGVALAGALLAADGRDSVSGAPGTSG